MKRVSILLAAFLIAVAMAGCTSQDSDPSGTSQAGVNQTQQDGAQPVDTPDDTLDAQEPASDADETDEPLAVGTEAELGGFSINVSGMEFLKSIAVSEYFSSNPDEGNEFLTVSMSVKNTGKEAATFLPSVSFGDDIRAKVIYADGYEFSATCILSYDQDLHDSYLNPLTSKSGIVAFQVPNEVVTSAEPISVVFKAGTDSVSYLLR